MPERVEKEERVISMTIEKAREVKELLRESMEGNRLPDEKDDRMEQVKVKRPKAEKDKTKIETQEGTHSGYGLAGETTEFKKAKFAGPPEDAPMPRTIGRLMSMMFRITQIVKRETITEAGHDELKQLVNKTNAFLDEYEKYTGGSYRTDEKYLRLKD